jgi:hypothetical protein
VDRPGYQNHGPLEGPKGEIDPNQGGTITDIQERSQLLSGYVLYTVRWDNGLVSRHYDIQLFCIGQFKDRSSFEAAIKPKGPVELIVGGGSGFRSARFELDYDGQPQAADVHDRRLWLECIEPKVKKLKLKVSTTKLKEGE